MNNQARNHLPSGGEYPTYFHLLADLHRRLRPARYLEIGVNEGHSLALSLPTTTSKDFFAYHDVMGLLGGLVDLAFVDGLHHFEVALADVLAIERYAHPGTVVLVHDVVPIDAPTSTRDRATLVWSGDVWNAVVLLRRDRPTLTITTLDVAPTGMARITGFEAYRADDREGPEDVPSRRDSDLWFDDAVASLLPATYADLVAMGPRALGTVPCTGQIVGECLARLPRPGPGSRTGPAQS